MKPKKQRSYPELFQSRLDQIIDMKHSLCRLAKAIDWDRFDEKLGGHYVDMVGAPGKPTRLMVGLHYLKYAFDESDEGVVERFVENPYWQFFCGFEYFQHTFPIDPSSMTRWRKRVGPDGVETLLAELIDTARRGGILSEGSLKRVVVDTTVQEKAIAFPTDARLYEKMRRTLVREARKRGIVLRQSYSRLGKKTLLRQHRYAHAKQFRRAARMTRTLKRYLGCVYRDIQRKAPQPDAALQELLHLASRLLAQKRHDSNKLYSIHAPEVECISKGKAHRRYEFGCKVGLVTSASHNWILGIAAFHDNPYDGHTLKDSLLKMQQMAGELPEEVFVDRGYRGHGCGKLATVHIVDHRRVRQQTARLRRWFKRRSAIEPVIGHAKSDHRMNRNFLMGKEGDRINAVLAGCGFNMRKLLAAFLWLVNEGLSSVVAKVITLCRVFGQASDLNLQPETL